MRITSHACSSGLGKELVRGRTGWPCGCGDGGCRLGEVRMEEEVGGNRKGIGPYTFFTT